MQALYCTKEYLNYFEPAGIPNKHFFPDGWSRNNALRKLDPPILGKRTRFIIKTLSPNVIVDTTISGCASAEDIFIPKIKINHMDMQFAYKRTESLVRISFAQCINTAQVQILNLLVCFYPDQIYA